VRVPPLFEGTPRAVPDSIALGPGAPTPAANKQGEKGGIQKKH
jgi:hypothetical protein